MRNTALGAKTCVRVTCTQKGISAILDTCTESVELEVWFQGQCQGGGGRHLTDSLEGELLHQVHDVGLAQELVLEGLDADREGGAVEHYLAVGLQVSNGALHTILELL